MRLEDACVAKHLTPKQYLKIRRGEPRIAMRFELMPIQDLNYIMTSTDRAKMEALLRDWDAGEMLPIRLVQADAPGRYVLKDGNHRLRVCRWLGYDTVAVVISPRP